MVKPQKAEKSMYIIKYSAFRKKHSKLGTPALIVNMYRIALNEN